MVSSHAHDPWINLSPILSPEHFQKAKTSIQGSVTIDEESWTHACESMQSSLHAKFLGKALPLNQAKSTLVDAWKGLGSFEVLNIPYGFYFIQCDSIEKQNHLLYEGPWTVGGRIF